MRSAGDTEIRVRAALLRLWARVPGHATDAEWKSDAVLDEVLRDGDGGDEWKVLDGVQRVGRAVAKGEGFNCSPGGWSELDDGLEYTYVRGTFKVLRRALSKEAKPGFVEGGTKVIESLPVKSKRQRASECDEQTARPEPQKRAPGNAWVEIHGAMMFCPCGHASDFTDHVKVFCSRAEATCEGCGARWGVPSAADCERLDDDGFPGSEEPRVTQRQLDLMRRASGGSLGHHRNFCHAPPDDADHIEWSELVAMGLAGEGEPPDSSCADENKGRAFHVTEAGFRMTYGDVRKARKRAKR